MVMLLLSLEKNNLGDWKKAATGLTNNVVYKNIDGLSIKGIDAATYNGQASAASTGNLNFNNFYFVTSGTLADIFCQNICLLIMQTGLR